MTQIQQEYERYCKVLQENGKTPRDFENFEKLVNRRLRREIKGGVKTLQYQLLTILCSNGQTPFISMSLNLEDCEGDKQWEEDTKIVFEEVLKQRIKGIPDKHGNLVPVIFPKLLYFLDERNNNPNTENWYLTKIAVESAAKTMAPDFISSKVQKKVKHVDHTWPSMGAARGDETVSIKIDDTEYLDIPIKDAYELLRDSNKVKGKFNPTNITPLWGVVGVYKITHKPTGKYYIGSSKNVGRRLNEHNCSTKHKGTLGDSYYIGDFEKDNYTRELLEECELDDLLDVEFKYVDLKDELCVNKKDPRDNGNFDSQNCKLAMQSKPYSTYQNKAYTFFKEVDGTRCFVKSKGEWVPIRKITFNSKDSPLKLYRVEYQFNDMTKILHITEDHPFPTQRGRIRTDQLQTSDILYNPSRTESYNILKVEETNERVETFDFEVDNDMFDLSGILSYNCRSFATVFNPPDLWENETVRFNTGYKETYTVRELYEQSKTDPQLYKYRMFLRNEGYYKGDVNEIDHFEEIDGKVKLVCRPKSWGFFNGGVVTLNLPYIALESHGNKAEFWRLLDQRCELVYRTLVERYKSLKNAPSDSAPILRQDGVITRLTDKETWNNFIVGPRCTYSLGYAGLWETQLYMTGKKLTEDQSFANEILNFFNKKHDEWHTRIVDKAAIEKTQDILSEKEYPEFVEIWNQNQRILGGSQEIIFKNYKDLETTEPNTALKIKKLYKNKEGLIKAEIEKTIQRGWLNTSTYGTPEENLTGKLSDSLKRDFGFIEGVTDHDYVTNSYHVDPAEPIDWANKILIESKLMDKSTGGAISYIELPNMSDNLEAVESIVQFMYDHILYCELNLKRDICYKCGFQGVIKLVKDNGKRVWECPVCRNRDTSEMFIRRRTCGYIGDANTGANQSRLADYEARVEHINIPLNMCGCGC